ncbi:MAG: CoA transferase [Saprospiraceae bacterium]|nr:CoA transferase [Saprospiraceae bacterium]
MTPQEQFFEGLKVVEFASVLAGPAVGMFFAELGAEVIKIENKTAGGDMTRGWKLPGEDPQGQESAYFCSVNWGKKHLFLDLGDPEERQQALQLALEADVVITNFKPSSARRWGLDPASLRAQNTRLIVAQLNAFADPEDESPAFDVVLQAEAGFLYMNGEAGGAPVKMPVALIDLLAAHQLKEAILLALFRRERSGEGAIVSTSLFESAVASLANQAANYLMAGHIPQRLGTQHPNIAPYGDVFTAADDLPVLLAVGTERQFRQLCRVLELDDLPENPDFQTNSARVRHREALNALLALKIARHPAGELLHRLKTMGVPAACIRDMKAVFDLPEARAMVLRDTLPDGRTGQRVRTAAFHFE